MRDHRLNGVHLLDIITGTYLLTTDTHTHSHFCFECNVNLMGNELNTYVSFSVKSV